VSLNFVFFTDSVSELYGQRMYFTFGHKREKGKLDKILHVADNNRFPRRLSIIACFLNGYNNTVDPFSLLVVF
jgi:hypothetical protein